MFDSQLGKRVRLSSGVLRLALVSPFVLLTTCVALAQTAPTFPITPRPSAATQPSAPVEPISGNAQRTRFVIGLDRTTEFQVFSLINPNRVIVELRDVRMQLPSMGDGRSLGLIKSFRGGLAGPGRSRVVIDAAVPVVVERSIVESGKDGNSHRLVLDIVPVDVPKQAADRPPLKTAAYNLGAQGLQPPVPVPAVRPELRAAKSYRPLIVIDPGHGGHDTGAKKNGTVEKDVVLAFSLALRDKLVATGRYKVLLTRDTDVFVPLEERRAFGEHHQAALFIAVHADYAKTDARGATIYSLRESVARELRRSSKGEVSSHVLSGAEFAALKQSEERDVLKRILAELAAREVDVNQERTSLVSRSVIEYMGEATTLRDDPDKSAAFKVLKTAQVPAVLIELAYVTNAEDARNLRSDAWRDKVSGSILTAVDNYFSHQIAFP